MQWESEQASFPCRAPAAHRIEPRLPQQHVRQHPEGAVAGQNCSTTLPRTFEMLATCTPGMSGWKHLRTEDEAHLGDRSSHRLDESADDSQHGGVLPMAALQIANLEELYFGQGAQVCAAAGIQVQRLEFQHPQPILHKWSPIDAA